MRKILTLIAALSLVASVAIGGSIAYLQDQESTANVMTLGNVYIDLIEQEWNKDKTELQDYTNGKPLMPAVGDVAWENEADNGGAYRRFTMNNVVDKYVSVTNTGKSDAYVRTVFAFEMGSMSYDEFDQYIGLSNNKVDGDQFDFAGAWDWETYDGKYGYEATINENKYLIMTAVHQSIVEPDETTIPSLLQVYMTSEAGNAQVESVDGNKNSKYDILVVAQAVQTEGFTSAEEALNKAFGESTADNAAKWFADAKSEADLYINSVTELRNFAREVNSGKNYSGKVVALNEDLDLSSVSNWTPIKLFAGTFDGQGHTISNLTVSNNSDAGLFSDLRGVVKNLTLKNVDIDSNHYAGAIVGYICDGCTVRIENCSVIGGSITLAAEKLSNGNYDNGDKLGGIVGYAGSGEIKNCHAENLTLKGYRDIGGIVGYAQGATNLSGNTVKNNVFVWDDTHNYKNYTSVSEADLGEICGEGGNGIEQETVKPAAETSNPTEINDALKAGDDVVLSKDVAIETPVESNGYAATGFVVNGGVLDGNGQTLSVPGANTTWASAISTTGGVIKNLTIDAGFRGIFIGGTTEKLYLDNVVIDGPTYTISVDSASGHGIEATNSTFNGWTSYAATIGNVKFDNCSFGEGSGYAFCRPYAPTEFVNCDFEAGYKIDARAAITLENCTFGGAPVTAANLAQLVTANTANASVK